MFALFQTSDWERHVRHFWTRLRKKCDFHRKWKIKKYDEKIILVDRETPATSGWRSVGADYRDTVVAPISIVLANNGYRHSACSGATGKEIRLYTEWCDTEHRRRQPKTMAVGQYSSNWFSWRLVSVMPGDLNFHFWHFNLKDNHSYSQPVPQLVQRPASLWIPS